MLLSILKLVALLNRKDSYKSTENVKNWYCDISAMIFKVCNLTEAREKNIS